jgi:ribosomal protein S18 acetylase RimI-like enzyme
MLRFLERAGFMLAPRLLLEREMTRLPLPITDKSLEIAPHPVRLLGEGDFESVVQIDKELTSRDRSDYFRRKFDEALYESAMCVSLVALVDEKVAGFTMARLDMGDFGRVEATASLDAIGVAPGAAGQGIARDMMTQLIDNLTALHVERLETEVACDHIDLLRFFQAFGFRSSQRLIFQAPTARR